LDTVDVMGTFGWTNTGAERPSFAITPGPGEESVWDYPRPPAIAPDSRRIVVGPPDDPLADSTRSVRILETASPPTFYVPPDDVRSDRLVRVGRRSFCEWKGEAQYWALQSDPSTPVGWSYPTPLPEFLSIAGWYAFYPARIACSVDDEVVRPQAGGFYGGWVTNEVVGPFKGEPGTGGW
jgi:uncharacterized protein (DUF427 family)